MRYTWLLIGMLGFSACHRNALPANTPTCVRDVITQIKAERAANPPAVVWKGTYKGQTAYYIPAKCCDIPSRLLDENCNVICLPDGGYTGKGDGRCPDFAEHWKNAKAIWKDNRKP